MKELSIKEKAELYDEAIKRARNHRDKDGLTLEQYETIDIILPELAESENESIKKEIINYFQCQSRDEPTRKDIHNKWIAWLEKQGEQKPADKIEPKFKIGDFLVNDYCMGRVVELTDDAYLLDTGQTIPFSCEHNVHLWTIEDAKAGDILVTKVMEGPFIFKGFLDKFHPKSPVAYCGIDVENEFMIPTGVSWWTDEEVEPATKKQRDLLFSKIKDAGYEWDAEKKELKKINNDNAVIKKSEKTTNWKPSYEQMYKLYWIADQNKDNMIGKQLMMLYNDLKKLM